MLFITPVDVPSDQEIEINTLLNVPKEDLGFSRWDTNKKKLKKGKNQKQNQKKEKNRFQNLKIGF